MPSQISTAKRCQFLEQRCEQLKQAMRILTDQHRDLLLRHNLLQAWCESLSLIQLNKMSQHLMSNADGKVAEFERLLEQEMSLLQELTSNPTAVSNQDAVSTLEVGVSTIAPPSDPMAYFKHHIAQPPLQDAANMTSAHLAKMARDCVLQIGVQLHLLQESSPEEHPGALADLQQAYNRIIHASMSLIMVGREDLVEFLNIVNLETMEADVEAANAQAATTAALIDKISLSPQQQHVIATGCSMYMQLLGSVMQERQRLQLQFAAAQGTSEGSSAGSSSNSSSSTNLLTDQFEGRQQLLEAQQKQVARLQLLMQKEFILRMAGMTWFIGCLSWQQIAKATVLCWPYTLRPSLLAREIWKHAEKQQANSQAGTSCSPGSGSD